jgi:hypothetical protein
MSSVVDDVFEVEYAAPAWESIGGMALRCQSPGGAVGVVGPADAQVPPSKWLLSIYGDDVSRPVRRYPSQELAQQHFAWAYCQPTHTRATQGETHILRSCSKDPLEAVVVRSKLFPNWPSWLVTIGARSVSVAQLDDAIAIAAAYVEGRQKTLELLLEQAQAKVSAEAAGGVQCGLYVELPHGTACHGRAAYGLYPKAAPDGSGWLHTATVADIDRLALQAAGVQPGCWYPLRLTQRNSARGQFFVVRQPTRNFGAMFRQRPLLGRDGWYRSAPGGECVFGLGPQQLTALGVRPWDGSGNDIGDCIPLEIDFTDGGQLVAPAPAPFLAQPVAIPVPAKAKAKSQPHGVFVTRNKRNVTGLMFVGRKPVERDGYWVSSDKVTVVASINSAAVAALGLQPGECRALQGVPELG